MRAIDADRLIDDLKHDVAMDQDSLDYEELTDSNREKIQFDKDCKQNAIDLLQNAPTIEPEIVRCKECKWYELPSHKITENCVRWMKSNGILLPIKPNDYCSYAERRTDDGD